MKFSKSISSKNFIQYGNENDVALLAKFSKENSLIGNLIEYLFWISLILYTNAGGILQALNIFLIGGRIIIFDILFCLLSICYLFVGVEHDIFDIDYFRIKKYLIFFLFYYVIVFLFVTPIINGNQESSFLFKLIKSRKVIYNILIFIYIYDLFRRDWSKFVKIFLISSIIISVLFIQGFITKINILPVATFNRGFVNIEMRLMISEGLMPLLIPLGTLIIIFKSNIKEKYLILFGFGLLAIVIVLSLERREILSIFIFFILSFLAETFIRKQYIKQLKSALKLILLTVSLIGVSYLLFPKYVETAKIGIIESFSVLINNKDMSGNKDVRMTFDKPFINELFYLHPVLGTGFDNRWRTGEGDKQGYEASDYPFLSALAMFGLMGVIFFVPVYIFLFQILKKDFDFLRTNTEIAFNLIHIIFLALFLYFIFHFLQYFNYFIAISKANDWTWYFFLSLYLASRAEFYKIRLANHEIKQIAF